MSAKGAGMFARVQFGQYNWEIYGLLGKVSASTTATVSAGGASATATGPDTSGAAYGLGFTYGTKGFGVGLEWMQYFKDLSAAALNISYTF
ncbi:MAG: hypothetical protein D6771_04895 [Zetaproteobacteria bacterium]|nr:MAG: hypothetical protein D6771_04895 [Zetaproteobacteria bacterium]